MATRQTDQQQQETHWGEVWSREERLIATTQQCTSALGRIGMAADMAELAVSAGKPVDVARTLAELREAGNPPALVR